MATKSMDSLADIIAARAKNTPISQGCPVYARHVQGEWLAGTVQSVLQDANGPYIYSILFDNGEEQEVSAYCVLFQAEYEQFMERGEAADAVDSCNSEDQNQSINSIANTASVAAARPKKRQRVNDDKPLDANDDYSPNENDVDGIDTEWLQNLYKFLRFRAHNGPDSRPSSKATKKERKLASWLNTQRQNLASVNNGTATPLVQGQIEVLQQINNFPFQRLSKEASIKDRINQLKAYKQEHGHCNVPSRDGKLGSWVHKTRENYKAGKLDNDLIRELGEIGFEWNLWDYMYHQLLAYKEKFGHCNVGIGERDKGYKALARWVRKQRDNYKNQTWVNPERQTKLEEIGFVWVMRENLVEHNPHPISNADRFNENFEKLKEYKAEHGHCNVHTKSGKLGNFVRKLRHLNQSGKLNNEQKVKLDEIGFAWSEWDYMYQQLQGYKENNGHCNVSAKDPVNKTLGSWVKTQRRNYKTLGKISEDRIAKLDEIGFVWCLGGAKNEAVVDQDEELNECLG